MKLKVASIVIVLALVAALGCMAGTSFASDPDYKVNTVKLEWEIPDIAVTYQIQKSWDADKLQWVESKYVASIDDVQSTFTLTNYSSDSIKGTVDFEVEESLASTSSITFANNGETISAFQKDPASSNTITATLKFDTKEFAKLDAEVTEAATYGTYTVYIAAA